MQSATGWVRLCGIFIHQSADQDYAKFEEAAAISPSPKFPQAYIPIPMGIGKWPTWIKENIYGILVVTYHRRKEEEVLNQKENTFFSIWWM